jgi:hypothetical protein
MTLRLLRHLLAPAVLAVVALAFASPAQATLAFGVNVQEGAAYVPGGGTNLTIGAGGVYSGSTADFSVVSGSITGVDNGALGSLDLGTLAISSKAAGTLFVTGSATGYTEAAQLASAFTQLSSHFVFGSGTVEFKAWVNSPGNTLFGMSTLVADIKGLNGTATLSGGPLVAPFSITLQLILTTAGAAQFSSDGSTVVTGAPEPGTMAAALAGLPLAYVGLRSRRRKS